MVEGTEKELLITLDFSGTKKKFADIDELHEFMQSQRDAWSWLEQAAREDDNLAQVWDPFKRYFMQADQFIERQEWHPDDQKKQTKLTEIFREQTQTAVDQGFTLADAPNARFVLDLKDKRSTQIAGYALAYLNKEKISLYSTAAYEGAYWTMKYLQGSTADSIEAQRKVQDSVQQSWTDRFEKQHENLEEKNNQLIRRIVELQEQSDLFTKRVDDRVTELQKQSNSQAIIIEQQMAENENTFKNQIASQERKFKKQTNSQATIFRQHTANREERFGNQATNLADSFKGTVAVLVKKFEELHAQTVKDFSAFDEFLKLGAPYHEAARYWRRKQMRHYVAQTFERLIAIAIAIITAIIFVGAAIYMFSDNSNRIKIYIDTIISTITPSAVASNAEVCNPATGAPALCGTVAGGSLAYSPTLCNPVNCDPLDCKAADCKVVDYKAVGCKAQPCNTATSLPCQTETSIPCKTAIMTTSTRTITNTTTPNSASTITTISTTNGSNNGYLDNLWKVSILLMISTLGFWLTRVSSRSFVSNQHLAMDCHERATILFTYLAMQNSKSPLTDGERPIVLETIFRPGSTGLINDDGPTLFSESAIKAFVKSIRTR